MMRTTTFTASIPFAIALLFCFGFYLHISAYPMHAASPVSVSELLPPPPIVAGSVVLVDFASGTILLTEKAHETRPPGTLTQLVTALVALDSIREGSLGQLVSVSPEAAHAPGYNLLLEVGETIPFSQLMKALLFLPGTDASIAIAEHVSGSIDTFSARMNGWAREHGLERSQFINPHGLDGLQHRATAFDLAKIGLFAMEDHDIRELLSQFRTRIELGGGRSRTIRNTNSFLWRYPRAIAAKSSYTPESGYSLIALAQKDGKQLLVTVVGLPSAEDRLTSATALLHYGFTYFDQLMANPRIDRIPYKVKEGDTLSGISALYGVPLSVMMDVNDIGGDAVLRVGDVISVVR